MSRFGADPSKSLLSHCFVTLIVLGFRAFWGGAERETLDLDGGNSASEKRGFSREHFGVSETLLLEAFRSLTDYHD